MRQTLRPYAATLRRILRVIFAFGLALSLNPFSSQAESNSPARREQAKSQFEKAERNRQTLEARPENARTLKEYTSLVTEYQRVYLITARAVEVPASIHHVGELYRTMGDLFDVKYYQRAVESFEFLLSEYPTSKYREESLLAIAQIQQDDLHDAALAQKTYERFLALHPHSTHAPEVRALLEKLTAANAAPKAAPVQPPSQTRPDRAPAKANAGDKTPPATDTKQGSNEASPPADDSAPLVSRIRTWNADTYTRIVIDVGAKVKYQAARISGPDRIYFDIEGAKLSPELLRKPIDVDGNGFLKTVRTAQNHAGVVRVVLEVNRVSDYSVFLLPDPYRLVVDVYGTSAAAEAAARSTSPPPGPTTTDASPANSEKAGRDQTTNEVSKAEGKPPAKSARAQIGNSQTNQAQPPPPVDSVAASSGNTDSAGRKRAANPGKSPADAGTDSQSPSAAKTTATANGSVTTAKGDAAPESDPPAIHSASVKKSTRPTRSAHDQAEEMGPAATPELTRNGQHSLTRALGLKIGRIVIDPGHGGRDTGTIGPTGLMEKDLCLDIALRLGKIIQQRLPSADVVFTREDDTYVPLERRTEIANESKADLFVSVHANSSQDRKARGIETYYLNFTGSSDAMEVASRENALSDNSVHNLQDIVAKIARNEKIEESRDLAMMIQGSLSKRMDNINRGERNRGVRKAPFVVLIGADMPSVLAEISFISNPSDEQWLKRPENRQRVAEGLYRGVESYLQSTNSLTLNQSRSSPESRAGSVARTGNSQ